MSFFTEHKRLQPVIRKAKELSIATNPAPEAVYEEGSGGFNVWCTLADKPAGWERVNMIAGAFSKPCEPVAAILWGWENENITHIVLSTDALALMMQDARENIKKPYSEYQNRENDLDWAIKKVTWLFEKAGVELPHIKIK